MFSASVRALSLRHAHLMKQAPGTGLDALAHKLGLEVMKNVDRIQSFRADRDFPIASPFEGSVWTGSGLCREASIVVCKALASFGYHPVYRYNLDVRTHTREEGSHAFITFEKEGRKIFVDPTWRQWVLDIDKIAYESPKYLEYLDFETPHVLVAYAPQIRAIEGELSEMRRVLTPNLMSSNWDYFPLQNILGAKTQGISYHPTRVQALLALENDSLAHLPSLHKYLYGFRK